MIPAGVLHSLEAALGQELAFVIFGTPPMAIEDDRAKPRRVESVRFNLVRFYAEPICDGPQRFPVGLFHFISLDASKGL